MANLQKLIDLDGLNYFLGQIKAKFVRSVNNIKPDSSGNVNIANMTGATYNSSGRAGLVPIPAAGKQDMALCGDATYKVLPIAGGGTGQTTAAGVRYVLGLGNTNGALPIANGGTGADNANSALSNLGILGAIVNASVSGKTITFTKKDNTTFSINTQDTNNGIVAANLAQNGYVKFSNGLILQWGIATQVGYATAYPITFPARCLAVVATYLLQYGTTYWQYPVSTQSVNRSSFIVATKSNWGAGDSAYWIAVGM